LSAEEAPAAGDSGTRRGGHAAPPRGGPAGPSRLSGGARAGILAGALLGSLLLVVAEFTTLFIVHVQTSSVPIKTVTTGSHHSYALIPIAVLGAVLAIGLLGIVALLIALLGDLPDAHATGLTGSSVSRYVNASSNPSTGLYLETLGAAVYVITCGVGLLAMAPPLSRPARRREPETPAE
jgi:hypothetical protein